MALKFSVPTYLILAVLFISSTTNVFAEPAFVNEPFEGTKFTFRRQTGFGQRPLYTLRRDGHSDKKDHASPSWPYDYCSAEMNRSDQYKPMEQGRLVKLQVVFRHGDRSPIRVLPNEANATWRCDVDELNVLQRVRDGQTACAASGGHTDDSGEGAPSGAWCDHSSWQSRNRDWIISYRSLLNPNKLDNNHKGDGFWDGNCIPGQLTEKGAKQHLELGRTVREIYGRQMNFLPEHFSLAKKESYIRSTDIWRTKQSLQSFIQGLYPNRRHTELLSYGVYPNVLENMYENPHACPRLIQLREDLYKSQAWQAYWKENVDLWETVRRKLRLNRSIEFKEPQFQHLADIIRARLCHGLPLPCGSSDPSMKDDCLTEDEARRIIANGDKELKLHKFDSENHATVVRLSIGGFLKELTENFLYNEESSSSDGNPDKEKRHSKKFYVYSGHDDTISSLMSALDGTDIWPPYASNLMIELWEKDPPSRFNIEKPQQYIRIFYNGEPLKTKTNWCNFGEGCLLEVFKNRVMKFLPKGDNEECVSF